MATEIIMRAELASICGVKRKTVTQWVARGKIPPPDVKISYRTMGWRIDTLEKAGLALYKDCESSQSAQS